MRTLSRLAVAAGVALSVLGLTIGAYGAVSGTATPNSNLQDQDSVHVHADGLPNRTGVIVLECTQGATSSADCEGQTADGSASSTATGTFDLDYTVLRLPNPIFASSSITCDGTHPCVLYVGTDFNDFSAPRTMIPISFAAVAATTTTTIGTPVPETGKAIALPLSAAAVFGGGLVITSRRRRRTIGAAK